MVQKVQKRVQIYVDNFNWLKMAVSLEALSLKFYDCEKVFKKVLVVFEEL